jgi:Arc-like DNA binding dprotein
MIKESPRDVQLKLRYRRALHDRLLNAAERNGASLNSEIVRRLEATFILEENAGGRATMALVAAIIADIAEIEAVTKKSWADDNETYSAVKRAVRAAIVDRAPRRMENHEEVSSALKLLKRASNKSGSGEDQAPAFPNASELHADTPEAQAEAERLRAAFDRAYQPQREAERRGRKLFNTIRRARRESIEARKR